MANLKVYLGDGAYAQFDGFGFTITAENGIEATDTVYLEPQTLVTFLRFVKAQGIKLDEI